MHDITLAALTGNALKSTVLVICGNVLILGLAIKATKLSWDDDFNKKLALFASASFCAIFVWLPDMAKKVVTDLAKVIAS
ncbi:hypothetical protein [Streptomyces fulvorobeus]|uniref:Uncharacterized protein n=1 Tax=Streptomyces fulvorobeus TaxID=284028 RepID=A0A7J0CFZ0_9ACTN|nr:hypothetical protein [Streptomyces fulvorobeus]NYE44861.1 hypothetical protein [Streptomyces fulvorobeus]GFN01421.1 hypothetical protein Sfulv_62310 [Streptomyces fulvorobeus]